MSGSLSLVWWYQHHGVGGIIANKKTRLAIVYGNLRCVRYRAIIVQQRVTTYAHRRHRHQRITIQDNARPHIVRVVTTFCKGQLFLAISPIWHIEHAKKKKQSSILSTKCTVAGCCVAKNVVRSLIPMRVLFWLPSFFHEMCRLIKHQLNVKCNLIHSVREVTHTKHVALGTFCLWQSNFR